MQFYFKLTFLCLTIYFISCFINLNIVIPWYLGWFWFYVCISKNGPQAFMSFTQTTYKKPVSIGIHDFHIVQNLCTEIMLVWALSNCSWKKMHRSFISQISCVHKAKQIWKQQYSRKALSFRLTHWYGTQSKLLDPVQTEI